jgi:hypothetical protein
MPASQIYCSKFCVRFVQPFWMVEVLVEGYHATISLPNLQLSPFRMKTALELFVTKDGDTVHVIRKQKEYIKQSFQESLT